MIQQGLEVTIQGVVQGVGFRPFVYRLATRMGVVGSIQNDGRGVVIRAWADPEQLAEFLLALRNDAPPLSRITEFHSNTLAGDGGQLQFSILATSSRGESTALIPPDNALCAECLVEMSNPSDRRFCYPFINCTNCGPRFTIVEALPYDRPGTSMKSFPMCRECQAEYDDPSSRRFHAQPNACPVCGPGLSWHDNNGSILSCQDPVAEAIRAIKAGCIVAMRGLGGFHLVVDAASEKGVSKLRQRKNRQAKPLAVMVADLEIAEALCYVDPLAREALVSPERPIVLLPVRENTGLAQNLAPGVNELGVFLPYTPLHHLLFMADSSSRALVMTSGNQGGAPICTSNNDALQRLSSIGDYFLLHNREIVTRIDDSVVRIVQKNMRIVRRARGYVPVAVPLSWQLPPTLACGGGLKSSFCLAKGDRAFPGQHIGDLFTVETFEFFTESIEHLKKLLEIEPHCVVTDMHPDYISCQYGHDSGLPLYAVQHHHAHAVSVMAEHGLDEPLLAVVLDGSGYGLDGTVWGGEILQVTPLDFERLGCLQPMPMPGGDKAAEQPWRMGISALQLCGMGGDLPLPLAEAAAGRQQLILAMLEKQMNCPLTSSCGRLFDAVASLLGVRQVSQYEGQGAMEIEALAASGSRGRVVSQLLDQSPSFFQVCLQDCSGLIHLQSSSMVSELIRHLERGEDVSLLAMEFQLWLITGLTEMVIKFADESGLGKVVLAGGCLQNKMVMEGLFFLLEQEGLQVFTGENIPVNDGGLSLGQAVIGGLHHVSGCTNAGS